MATLLNGRLTASLATACAIALTASAIPDPPPEPGLSRPLDLAVLTYTVGDDFSPFAATAESLRGTSADQRRAAEEILLGLLQNPGTTQAARVELLALLESVAGPASAEPIGRLLTDPVLSHAARQVLQDLDSPMVTPLLLAAIHETEGDLRIGMIGSAGRRHTHEAVDTLAGLTAAPDGPTAQAALQALGETGTIEAAAALIKASVDPSLEGAQLDALLQTGETLRRADFIQTAAAVGELLAVPPHPARIRLAAHLLLARTHPRNSATIAIGMMQSGEPELIAGGLGLVVNAQPDDATRQLAALLTEPGVPTEPLLDALADRGDITARPTVLALINDEDETIRAAALDALGRLGSPDEVNLLIARLQAGKAESRAAESALVRLPQIEVDIDLLRRFRTFEDPPTADLARILATRSNRAAVPFMLEAALRSDRTGRESVRALSVLAEPSDAPELIALLDLVTPGFRRGVEQAVTAAMNRSETRPPSLDPILGSYAAAGSETRLSLLRITGAIGGPEASSKLLDVHRNGSAEERATVQSILSATTDPGYLDLLRSLATGTDDSQIRTPLIRSVLRISANLPDWRAIQAVEIIASVVPVAKTAEEKSMISATAANRRIPEALSIVQGYLDDPEIAAEAQAAATELTEALAESSALP